MSLKFTAYRSRANGDPMQTRRAQLFAEFAFMGVLGDRDDRKGYDSTRSVREVLQRSESQLVLGDNLELTHCFESIPLFRECWHEEPKMSAVNELRTRESRMICLFIFLSQTLNSTCRVHSLPQSTEIEGRELYQMSTGCPKFQESLSAPTSTRELRKRDENDDGRRGHDCNGRY